MSLKYFHRDLLGKTNNFDTTITWGETLTGEYQNLPNSKNQTEIDYGTVLGVDTFMHVPFITRIDDSLIVTWQQGLEDEDAAGQSINARSITGDVLSSRLTVFPAVSNSSSLRELILINSGVIEYQSKYYYLTIVYDKNGTNEPIDWISVGVLGCEHLTSTTFGTPFWVYTQSGEAVIPQSGFPAYSFNDVSANLRGLIRSDLYQIFTFLDENVSDFDGVLKNGINSYTEISAIKVSNQFIRISRDFTDLLSGGKPKRQFFDFGDGVPVISDIPSSAARSSLIKLNDGRVALCGGTGNPLGDRLELFFAIADKNTLNFRQENIYRVIFGQATGQIFPGAFKNGLWSYPNMIHDTDNKIKIVCSKYKEGIFLFEFDYADISVTT